MGFTKPVPRRPHPDVWVLVVTMLGGYWIAVCRLATYCAHHDKSCLLVDRGLTRRVCIVRHQLQRVGDGSSS